MENFHIWYKKYVNETNSKFDSYIESLNRKLKIEQDSLSDLINVRNKSNLSFKSDLDEKIKQKSDIFLNVEENINKLSTLKKEIKERLSEDSSKENFIKLKKHPKISEIVIDGDNLKIITKKLKTNGHNIGHYEFCFNPVKKTIYIKNLEYVVKGMYDHWHVNYGDPCLADWKPILWRYIDTFQLFLFVDTLFHYLVLSNSEHGYMSFEDWIELFDKKEKIEKKKEQKDNLSNNQLAYIDGSYSTGEMTFPTGWSTTRTVYLTSTISYWSTGT